MILGGGGGGGGGNPLKLNHKTKTKTKSRIMKIVDSDVIKKKKLSNKNYIIPRSSTSCGEKMQAQHAPLLLSA